MSAFLDTSFVVSFLREDETDHSEAVRLVRLAHRGNLGALFTSDYVYDESVTLALRRGGPKAARDADTLLRAPPIQTLRVSPDEWEDARKRFLQRAETRLSFTDWCIVLQCERRGIDTILSFDRGFDGIYARNVAPPGSRRGR